MNAPSPLTDIRVGDLVKATRRDSPESSKQFRVEYLTEKYADGQGQGTYRDHWDFEVLDRPLPPIDEELLLGAINAYRKAEFFNQPFEMQAAHIRAAYRRSFTDVINYLRQHDTYNKESK